MSSKNFSKKKRIAYVGSFAFPNNDAGAQRVLGIASSLHDLNFEVLIGAGLSGNNDINNNFKNSSPFKVSILNEYPERKTNIFVKLLSMLTWGKNTRIWLDSLNPKPDFVFVFCNGSSYIKKILPWCRHQNIPMICDVVEWYQPSHLPGGRLGPLYWDNELSMRFYFPQAGNIIAISSYLEKYYQKKECTTVRIPPTLDVRNISANCVSTERKKISLVYAGYPGKKDLIDNVLEGILLVDPKQRSIEITLIGPTEENILSMPSLRSRNIKSLPEEIHVLGPQLHDKVTKYISEADYMPLLRPPLRYAQAGFPTKVPESLALGTPVICNLTSDLGEFIHHGVEGFVCSDYSPQSFCEILEHALSLSIHQRTEMRMAARRQAENSFDYRVYIPRLQSFLEKITI